jgi:agmatine/peptidylarginine deiminase
MKKQLILFCVIMNVLISYSQQEMLPRWMTEAEKAEIPAYKETFLEKEISTPPVGSEIRTPGQWEEVQAVCITWTGFPSIHRQLVTAIQEECEVWIVCSDSNAVKTNITSNGGSLTNVKFVESGFNSIWMRDYGPNSVYLAGVDSLVFVDWIYNRPRPLDDTTPNAIGDVMGIDVYAMNTAPYDLVHTGGNFMADGFGRGFSSYLVDDENDAGSTFTVSGQTSQEVSDLMEMYQGIDTYIKMNTLPYDGIHHIDMHMKLMNEETLLIGEFPAGASDGPQIELNIQYIQDNYTTVFGTPFKIVRVPMPPSTSGAFAPNASYRTYANNVIVNKTVIVPTYRTEYDTTALRIIQETMPGYNVVGIDVDNSSANLIGQGGALHCITKEVATDDPLLISHQNLPDTQDDQDPYSVTALIRHKSGIQQATLYYKTSLAGNYTSVPMTFLSGNNWLANIPAQAVGTRVYYYIHAEAVSGKTQVRPITAPDGYFSFLVYGTNELEELNDNMFGQAFPNPTSGLTCIPVNNELPFEGKLELLDQSGRTVKMIHQGNFPKGPRKYFFDGADLPAGMYYLKLSTSEHIEIQKMGIGL